MFQSNTPKKGSERRLILELSEANWSVNSPKINAIPTRAALIQTGGVNRNAVGLTVGFLATIIFSTTRALATRKEAALASSPTASAACRVARLASLLSQFRVGVCSSNFASVMTSASLREKRPCSMFLYASLMNIYPLG